MSSTRDLLDALRRAEVAEAKLTRIGELFSDDKWWVTSEQRIRREVLTILGVDG